MPRFPIKPLIKLSKEQWKVLLERIMQKEGKFTAKGAGAVMGRPFEPPVTKEVGALYKDVPIGAGEVTRTVERLPIEEARAKYMQAPEQYVTPRMWAPSAKVMRPAAGPEEELAAGLAYERVKEVPLLPPISRTARTMQKEIASKEMESALKRVGLTKEDIRPGVKPELVLEEKGINPKNVITVPPVEELTTAAAIADEMWRNMGGGRGIGAKVWQLFKDTQRRPEEHIKTARDYFISCFVKWRQGPRAFANTHPKEARVLNQLWREFEESLKPQPTAIPGTIPPGGEAGGGVTVGGVE